MGGGQGTKDNARFSVFTSLPRATNSKLVPGCQDNPDRVTATRSVSYNCRLSILLR